MVQLSSHFDKTASPVPDGATRCTGKPDGAVQRGPLRPHLMSPSRDRLSGATIVRTLRAIDRAALFITATVILVLRHQMINEADAVAVTAPPSLQLLPAIQKAQREAEVELRKARRR